MTAYLGSDWEVTPIIQKLGRNYEEVGISLILGVFTQFFLIFTIPSRFRMSLNGSKLFIFTFLWKPSDSVIR